MLGRDVAEKMLFTHGVSGVDVKYGSHPHYNAMEKSIYIRAIEPTKDMMIANAAHEAAHAIQCTRNPAKTYFNAVVRNLPLVRKIFRGFTVKIEKEANDIASKWLLENKQLFPDADIRFIIDHYYPKNLRAYA